MMRALTGAPKVRHSARLDDIVEPPLSHGAVPGRPIAALQRADRNWLARLITRRLPADGGPRALDPQPDDIKVVVDF